jgi:hypothetical protein
VTDVAKRRADGESCGGDSEPMRQRLRVRLGVKSNALFLEVVALFAIVGTLQSGCTSCRVAPSPTPAQRLAEALRKAGTLTSAPPAASLVCPMLGSTMAPPALQAKGGHRVILSWRASAPADSKHAAAVGYCIYRSIKPKDPWPELVNSIPFPGTSCVDDLVENGKKYYYVVRAISAKGVISITSNPAPAPIPTWTKTSPYSGTSVPACREATQK